MIIKDSCNADSPTSLAAMLEREFTGRTVSVHWALDMGCIELQACNTDEVGGYKIINT